MKEGECKYFKREIEIQIKVEGNYCLPLIGFTVTNDNCYAILLPKCDMTLEDYLKENADTLSINQRVEILLNVLKGLQDMHNKKYIHRDIKVCVYLDVID